MIHHSSSSIPKKKVHQTDLYMEKTPYDRPHVVVYDAC
jgi:hypothetical protein